MQLFSQMSAGYCSPSADLKFADIPNGLAALSKAAKQHAVPVIRLLAKVHSSCGCARAKSQNPRAFNLPHLVHSVKYRQWRLTSPSFHHSTNPATKKPSLSGGPEIWRCRELAGPRSSSSWASLRRASTPSTRPVSRELLAGVSLGPCWIQFCIFCV